MYSKFFFRCGKGWGFSGVAGAPPGDAWPSRPGGAENLVLLRPAVPGIPQATLTVLGPPHPTMEPGVSLLQGKHLSRKALPSTWTHSFSLVSCCDQLLPPLSVMAASFPGTWQGDRPECLFLMSAGSHPAPTPHQCLSLGSHRCVGCEAVLSGIEEQVSRANQYKEQQLGLRQQIESEVSQQGSRVGQAPPA